MMRDTFKRWHVLRGVMNVLLLVLAVTLVTSVAFAAKKRATKFVLAKTEGTVSVVDSAKEEREILTGMQLHNGDHQVTKAESYAWVTLDESKAIKLDENTETYLKKRWGKLEVFTVTGQIWFNVTVPVAKEEAYNIRTSTMVTGIRGTCGWVGVSDDWKSTVYLLTGELECLVVNPLDGGSETITLKPGEYAEFYVFPKSEIDGEEASCGVTKKTFTKEDIPGFILEEILGDTELINKIYKESGIDLRDLTPEYVTQRKKQDQERHAKEIKEIKEKAADEINFVEKEPVWKPENGETASAVAYMIMPQTAETVQKYLDTEKYKKVVLLPGEGTEEDNTLKVDIPFDTPKGKILETQPGVQVDVEKGNSFTVDGTVNLYAKLTNNGTVTVNSANTLNMHDLLINHGTLEVTATGRLVLLKGMTTDGTFINSGIVEDDTDSAGSEMILANGGVVKMVAGMISSDRFDTIIRVASGAKVNFQFAGGSIANEKADGASIEADEGDFKVTQLGTDVLGISDTLLGKGVDMEKYDAASVFRKDERYHLIELSKVESYPVVVGEGIEHGTIVAPTRVEVGAKVTLKAIPDAGYQLGSLTVNSYNVQSKRVGGAISLAADQSFIMPANDVIIGGRFDEIAQAAATKYQISIANMDGGSVSTSASEAEAGTTVKLTVLVEGGHELESLTVLDADGKAVGVAASGNGYEFTMPEKNVTVNATFRTVDVNVVFYDDDERTVLNQQTIGYGEVPKYKGEKPEKKADEKYTYLFTGWKNGNKTYAEGDKLPEAKGDMKFVAVYAKKDQEGTFVAPTTYTVTWRNYEGTVLEKDDNLSSGARPKYDGATPTRDATVQYTYVFSGWSDGENTYVDLASMPAVTKDVTYQAVFTGQLNKYTITWKNENGDTLATSEEVPYGEMPVYEGEEPEKDGDAQYSYKFSSWSPAVVTVTGNATYVATFTQITNTYTIRFLNEDGSVHETLENIPYGTTPAYTEAPQKAGDAQYSYIFSGWTPDVVPVTGDADYTALFTANVNSYKVTWLNDEGNVLRVDNAVEYGTAPSYGAFPTKASTQEFSYSFGGWTVGGVDYAAGTALPGVTGDVTATAYFNPIKNKYSVTFLNDDGSVWKAQTAYDYGTTASTYAPADATKAPDAQYTYTFSGWTSDGGNTKLTAAQLPAIEADIVYTATYTNTINNYSVVFNNEDDSLIKDAGLVAYGTDGNSIAPAAPTKVDDQNNHYVFVGWNDGTTTYSAGNLPTVKGTTVYKATFSATEIVHPDGVSLDKGTIDLILVDGSAAPTASLLATITPSTAENQAVTWASDNESAATVVGNGKTATVTAVANGTAHITVKTADGGLTASCTVTVTTAVSGVTLDKPTANVILGTTETLKATITPATASNQRLTWKSGNDNIVTVAAGTEAGTAILTPVSAGTTTITVETADGGKTATCDVTVSGYTVLFLNEGGAQLDRQTNVALSATPTYKGAAEPAMAATQQYTYAFAGWKYNGTEYAKGTALPEVTGDMTFTAYYTSKVNKYTATFVDYDGKTIASVTYDYDTPASTYAPADPSRGGNAQYSYAFTGWKTAGGTAIAKADLPNLTDNVTYTAEYTTTTNSYNVTFQNDDGTVLKAATAYPYGTAGSDIVQPTDTPEKATDTTYYYTFVGWNLGTTEYGTDDLPEVNGAMVFVARYTGTPITHVSQITLDKDPINLVIGGNETDTLTAILTPEIAQMREVEWTSGDESIATLTENEDGSVTITGVGNGTTTITAKAVDYEYNNVPSATCTVNVTTAVTGVSLDKHDITLILGSEQSEEVTATVLPEGKASDTYVTWTSTDANVAMLTTFQTSSLSMPIKPGIVGEADVTVKTREGEFTDTVHVTVKGFTVTFVDDDDANNAQLYQVKNVAFGNTVVYGGSTEPSKASSISQDFTFTGWNDGTDFYAKGDQLPDIEDDTTFKAVYEASPRKYNVSWVDGNGDTIYGEQVPYGTSPAYNQAQYGEPGIATSPEFEYTFSGWKNGTQSYDKDATLPAINGSDVTYAASFTSTKKKYTISFFAENASNMPLHTMDVAYGDVPVYDGPTPTRTDANGQYVYTFAEKWTKKGAEAATEYTTLPAVDEAAAYVAVYKRETAKYDVTFVDEDGITVLQAAQKVEYGSKPTYSGSTPEKTESDQYTYQHAGWNVDGDQQNYTNEAMPTITKDTTLKARYRAIPRTYTITYDLNAGTDTTATITGTYAEEYTFGTGATLPTATNVKRDHYAFAGWFTSATPDDGATAITTVDTTTTGNQKFYAKWIYDTGGVYYSYSKDGNDIVLTFYAFDGTDRSVCVDGAMSSENYIDTVTNHSINDVTKLVIAEPIYPNEMASAFMGAVEIEAIEGLNLIHTEKVTDMGAMFAGCDNLKSLDLTTFDTTNVTNMNDMFADCIRLETLDVSRFDTTNVTTMASMFSRCKVLTGLDLTSFNTANVTDMSGMFNECEALTALDLTKFNTANVTQMANMFKGCKELTTIYASDGFDVTNVSDDVDDTTGEGNMFDGCSVLEGGNGTKAYAFEVSNVLDKTYARIDGKNNLPGYFTDKNATAKALYYTIEQSGNDVIMSLFATNADGRMDISKAALDSEKYVSSDGSLDYRDITKIVVVDEIYPTNMARAFYGMGELESIENIGNLHTENVTDMNSAFFECGIEGTLDLSSFDTSNVVSMYDMFRDAKKLTSIKMDDSFNTSKVESFEEMFYGCSGLTRLDVSMFNTSNATNFSGMFQDCEKLTTLNLSNFNTQYATDMSKMFCRDSGLTTLNLSNFNTQYVEDMSFMFSSASGLRSLNLSNFDTTSVTDMSQMFSDCSSLTSITFGQNFSTANVTDMERMFGYCEKLASIDLSGFDTSSVKNFIGMFESCTSLTSLDVTGFDTTAAIEMEKMFRNCSGLTSIDLSQLNTANVTNMKQMFDDCSGFTSIDVSSFDTTNVRKMRDMFNNCTNLTTIDVSNFKTANVTDMYGMFASDSADYKLTTIYVSTDFVTSAVTDGDYMFYNRRAICGGQDTVYGDIVDHTYARIDDPDNSKPGYFTDKNQTLGAAGLYYTLQADNSVVTLRLYGHANGTSRTEITSKALDSSEYVNYNDGLYATDITKVIVMEDISPTSLKNAFYGCSKLEAIENADRIHTDGVTSMASAFEGCSVLATLDLTSFDTSDVTEMANMFAMDAKLTTIYVSDTFDVTGVTDDVNAATGEGNMFTGCVSLVGGLGTRVSLGSSEYNPLDKTYAWPDGKNDKPGYFTSRDIVDNSNLYYDYNSLTSTLTFYDTPEEGRWRVAGGKMNSSGYLYPYGNPVPAANISKIVFADEVYPTDMNRAFKDMTNLTAIENLGNLHTDYVKNMDYAFYMTGLEGELDLSGLDLSNVTSMEYMFYGSLSLTSVKLGGASSNLTNMKGMFYYSNKLESVTFTNFDTSNVTDMSEMFEQCEALISPSVAGLDASSVTTMYRMYYGCEKLTSFDVTGTSFSTARVTDFKEMFRRSGITSVNTSLFNTANATDLSCMFAECKDLTSLDLSGFVTTNVTKLGGMFMDATKLASVDLSSFNTAKVTEMGSMFKGCTSLTKLDLSSFDTTNVTDMSYMFGGDEVDYKLTTILASASFVTGAVTQDANMFSNRLGLVGGQGTTNNGTYAASTSAYAHIDDAANNNPGYFTDPSDTPTAGLYYNMVANGNDVILRLYSESGGGRTPLPNGELNSDRYQLNAATATYDKAGITKVMIMDNISPASVEHAFDGCTSLKEITDIDKLHIDNLTVASLAYMFNGCAALTELDLTSFNTAAITDMTSLFAGCSKLETIYVSDDFVTTSVTADADMFDGCTSLVGGYGTRPYYDASTAAYDTLDKTYARIDSSTAQGFFTKKGDVAASIYYGFTEAGTGEYVLTLYADPIKGVTEELPKGSIRSDAFANRVVSQDQIVKVVIAQDIYPTNMVCAFRGLENVESFEGMDILHTENVRDMTGAFAECSSLMEINLSNFDTSKVLNMKGMFYDCTSMATLNVGSFNTANVTNMENMFAMSRNGLLGTIYASTSFVTTGLPNAMTMFGNTPILCGGSGTDFNDANISSAYARIDSDATPGYFSDATMLATTGVYYTLLDDDHGDYALQLFAHPGGGRKQLPNDALNSDYYLPTKDTSITTAPKDSIVLVIVNDDIYPKNMESAFDGVRDGNSEPLMFMNIDKIHTENVTSMKRAFAECFVSRGNTNELDLSSFDTSKVTDMSEMFAGNTELEKVNLTGFDTSKVTSMAEMFKNCSSLTTIYVSDTFTVASLTDGGTDMFSGCNKLVGQAGTCTIYPDGTASAYPLDKRSAIIDGTGTAPTPGFFTDGVNGDTSSIYYSITTEDMCVLLLYATPGTGRTKLENGVINYKNFAFPSGKTNTDIQRISIEEDIYPRNMVFAFNGMNPQNGDFYGLDKLHTENVMDMTNAFSGFTLLSELDLSGFNTANVRSMAGMFKNSTGLNTIYASTGFVTTNVTDSTDMFAGCINLSGPNTAYDASNVDATYARVDETGNPGYFTAKLPPISGTLNINGFRQVGRMLTASLSSTDQTTLSGTPTYTWYGSTAVYGTGETYTLTNRELSDDLYCTVTTDATSGDITVTIDSSSIAFESDLDFTLGVDDVDVDGLQTWFDDVNINYVTLLPGPDESKNTLIIDKELIIENGKTLMVCPGVTIEIGVNGSVTSGAIVNVSDHSIHNYGTIVVSSNGMLINGDEENPGRIVNYEGGKIVVEGTFENVNGTIENAGEIINVGQVQNKENGLLKGGLENAYGGVVENDGTIQTPDGEQAVTEGFGAYIGNPELIGETEEGSDVQEARTETEEPGTGSGALEGQEAGEEGASQVEAPHFPEIKVGPSDEEYAKVKQDAEETDADEADGTQALDDADEADGTQASDDADTADGTEASDDTDVAQGLEDAGDAGEGGETTAGDDASEESADSKDGDLPTEDAKKPEDLDLPKQDALKPEDALKPDDLADLDGEPQGDADETGSTDETSAAEEPADEATTAAADDENA